MISEQKRKNFKDMKILWLLLMISAFLGATLFAIFDFVGTSWVFLVMGLLFMFCAIMYSIAENDS